jgi:hypothetical protein
LHFQILLVPLQIQEQKDLFSTLLWEMHHYFM